MKKVHHAPDTVEFGRNDRQTSLPCLYLKSERPQRGGIYQCIVRIIERGHGLERTLYTCATISAPAAAQTRGGNHTDAPFTGLPGRFKRWRHALY